MSTGKGGLMERMGKERRNESSKYCKLNKIIICIRDILIINIFIRIPEDDPAQRRGRESQ